MDNGAALGLRDKQRLLQVILAAKRDAGEARRCETLLALLGRAVAVAARFLPCARGVGLHCVERIGLALRGNNDVSAHERRNSRNHEAVEAPLWMDDDVYRDPDEAAVPVAVVELLRGAEAERRHAEDVQKSKRVRERSESTCEDRIRTKCNM